MKTTTFLPSPPSPFGGALNKRSVYLTILGLIIATLWNTHSVSAAPAKTDLQPPIFEATASASFPSQSNGGSEGTTIDSYGNPIESLQPIETPDGRKVVSAQGLQFEIPNYASGITELKKPADDLLPPFVDKIGSSSEEVPTKQKNPFLPSAFNDGKYRPKSTTTTTTTTTPAPEIVEENPFEPTIPPWLRDFDYPDLAPGVPFVYDPNEDENPVDKNILPPSKTDDTNKSTFNSDSSSSSNSPFLNSQKPQGFTNKFTSSAISLASSSSIPSIVTIPLPSTQTNQADNTVTRPPLVFVPPPTTTADGIIIADKVDDITKKTSSTFNKNFAAPFEPTTVSSTLATTASDADQKKVPLSADRESFPPFNNVITGSSTLPSKTTFTKSEDGKVITNNIFLSGSIGSTSAKPFGSSLSQEKNIFSTQSVTGSSITKSTTASTIFKQFGTTSSAASGFVKADGATSTFGSTSINDGFKYTGRFGGPPGVLAPQNSGLTTSSTTVTKSYNKPAFTTFGVTSTPGFTKNNNDKFTGSFGGPPGILKPYDNVKNR